jgi:hypothetical protein
VDLCGQYTAVYWASSVFPCCIVTEQFRTALPATPTFQDQLKREQVSNLFAILHADLLVPAQITHLDHVASQLIEFCAALPLSASPNRLVLLLPVCGITCFQTLNTNACFKYAGSVAGWARTRSPTVLAVTDCSLKLLTVHVRPINESMPTAFQAQIKRRCIMICTRVQVDAPGHPQRPSVEFAFRPILFHLCCTFFTGKFHNCKAR